MRNLVGYIVNVSVSNVGEGSAEEQMSVNGLHTLILILFSGYEAILDSDSFFRIASYPVNNFRTNVSKPLH